MSNFDSIATVETKNETESDDVTDVYEDTAALWNELEPQNEASLSLELSMDTINQIIKTHFPNWIVHRGIAFVEECDAFTTQWIALCKKLKKPLAEVIIVEQTFLQERINRIRSKTIDESKHKCIMKLCDLLTEKGNFVRDSAAFSVCTRCRKIMLPINWYQSYGLPANGKCLRCNRHDPRKMKELMSQTLNGRQKTK